MARSLQGTTSDSPMETVLTRLHGVTRRGKQWQALCPAHGDRKASLSISEGDDGRVLLNCFSGCTFEAIVRALELRPGDLFATKITRTTLKQRRAEHKHARSGDQAGEGERMHDDKSATVHPVSGCTLAQYAEKKRLPIETLRSFGLSDMYYGGKPAIRIPYRSGAGTDISVRFRVELEKDETGDNRFKWKTGSRVHLYGLERLAFARERGFVVLVEGESDCHTLWHHGVPAVGLPGAALWKDERDASELEDIPIIYAVVEPDNAGESFAKTLAGSRLNDRIMLLRLPEKDPSALYLSNPDHFLDTWNTELSRAVAISDEIAAEARQRHQEAEKASRHLAVLPDITSHAADVLEAAGLVGERRLVRLLYLSVTSRLLERPVSAVIKGPSSGGKSHILERVLALMPPDAYYTLTAMSEHALAYGDEPLEHRMLVIFEAAGFSGDFASYLIRSMLSEGRIRYETVEKTSEGMKPRLIERPGPTGLLVTTTATKLHPENETRLLSLTVSDTQEQTAAVLHAIANEEKLVFDPSPWHALQTWIAGGVHEVTVPFGPTLSRLIPPLHVRLKRDFTSVRNLVCANAILHQATRKTTSTGVIIATLDDYAVVRGLVAHLVAEGIGATVPASVRETVEAVRKIVEPTATSLSQRVRIASDKTATISEIGDALGIDKSAASRRVADGRERGFLVNLEEKKGKPARITLGESLPEDMPILPTVEVLEAEWEKDRCTVAALIPKNDPPPSLTEAVGSAGGRESDYRRATA